MIFILNLIIISIKRFRFFKGDQIIKTVTFYSNNNFYLTTYAGVIDYTKYTTLNNNVSLRLNSFRCYTNSSIKIIINSQYWF